MVEQNGNGVSSGEARQITMEDIQQLVRINPVAGKDLDNIVLNREKAELAAKVESLEATVAELDPDSQRDLDIKYASVSGDD